MTLEIVGLFQPLSVLNANSIKIIGTNQLKG